MKYVPYVGILIGVIILVALFVLMRQPGRFLQLPTYQNNVPSPGYRTSPLTPAPLGTKLSSTIPRIKMHEIWVKNFYYGQKNINQYIPFMLIEKSNYTISYTPVMDNFVIDIKAAPFLSNVGEAEKDFLYYLQIEKKEDACKLPVQVITEKTVNPNEANKSYGLSFCK